MITRCMGLQVRSEIACPRVPMGANAGEPHNVEMQTGIVKATLEQLVKLDTPGKVVPLPFEYVAKV